ncbi:MAG TPA: hypothetical protein VF595_00545 [Tepidisphaeraceae bacterium]|jgi:hypothetical protein
MDYTPNSRRLSEISHLFLSDVRKKQTGSDARPQRQPPGHTAGAAERDNSVDLTPEEFASVMRPLSTEPVFKPVRAVIAHHLGQQMQARVVDLAVALGGGEPVGVIYADDANVRVCRVDAAGEGETTEIEPEAFDAQRLREVLVELDQDVCQWLLVLPDHRAAETKALLNKVAAWTLLSGTDHDGVVSAYRTLKGVCGDSRPRLSVSVLGDASAEEVEKTCQKLAGVCQQFLKVDLATGPTARPRPDAAESCLHEAFSECASNSHWPVLAALADGAAAETVPTAAIAESVVRSTPMAAAADSMPFMRMTPPPARSAAVADGAETIIDLPDADASPTGILRAVVLGGSEWAESPVRPPMMPEAVVAVARDRRLTLLAVARPGLSDLRAIAAAFRWMDENRTLIAMALPQFNVDSHAAPRLHVLIDHVDAAADALHPLLAAGSVSVAAYRRVHWAGKTGLLLEAA